MATVASTQRALPLGATSARLSGLKTLRENWRIAVGIAVLAPVIVLAVLWPMLPLPKPLQPDLSASLSAPAWAHVFGTDRLGRDILSRTLAGAQTSLLVGFSVASLALLFGVVVGAASGFLGKKVDMAVMAVMDILLAFPGLLLAIGIVAGFGAGLTQVILAIAVSDIPRAVRLQRSLVLGLKSRPFIDAARMAGAPAWWTIARHVVPNTIAPMLVAASIYAANAIIVEASLSFLGLGILPPEPSWGNLVREGQTYLEQAWWISTFPALAIVVTAVALHLLADGAHQRLDPSLRS